MKRFSKILVRALVLVLMAVACLSSVACKDIRNVKLTVSYYDDSASQQKEIELSVDFYREFAPETVDAMLSYIEDGYFDGCIFYKTETESNVLKVGDLKMVDGQIVKNDIKPTIDGEFENGKVKGSNLQNKKGSIGLWRSWTEHDGNFMTSTSTDTGRSTWFMPLTESPIASYEGWFCIFAQIDLEADGASDAFTAIDNLFTNENCYKEYVVYYTGEYDANKADQDYGLEFNCVEAEEFDEETTVFEAEGDQLVCYNKVTIRVAFVPDTDTVTALIKKAK